MRSIKHFFFVCICILPAYCFAGMATFADRPAVQNFIEEMSQRYQFNEVALNHLFQQVKVREDILNTVTQASTKKAPWFRYRHFFITDQRINKGVAFWKANQKILEAAQNRYGVPASIIVAIIGVESEYGQFTGKYRVIDTLSTLAFSHSPRAHYFKNELVQFLLLSRELKMNPLAVTGSYAGAIGMPQFMPTAYRHLAVKAKGKGKADLIHNSNDAILSVANYFKNYGWKSGEPVISDAYVRGGGFQRFANKGFRPKLTLQQLASNGIKPNMLLAGTNKAIVIKLEYPGGDHYRLGYNNFYVITGYNPSLNYAMAVYELGQEIQKEKNREFLAHNKTITPKITRTASN